MSDTNQLRQAVALMLDVMPNSPIFSAVQVNALIVDKECAATKPLNWESPIAWLVAGLVLTQEQVNSIRRLVDSATSQGNGQCPHDGRPACSGCLHTGMCHATAVRLDTSQIEQAVNTSPEPVQEPAKHAHVAPEGEQPAAAELAAGVLHCARCGLHVSLVRKAYEQAKAEGCPNGCGPLWSMTWEQHAKRLESMVASLQEDAERYRCLRPESFVRPLNVVDRNLNPLNDEELDGAVDAERWKGGRS